MVVQFHLDISKTLRTIWRLGNCPKIDTVKIISFGDGELRDGWGIVPAAPRTATFTCAGRVVEKDLACKRLDRIMPNRMECILYESNQLT